MYNLPLRTGRVITSAELTRELSALECGPLIQMARMQHLVAIESLEARGAQYANHDFDVLAGALNFMDAVQPEHTLRNPTEV